MALFAHLHPLFVPLVVPHTTDTVVPFSGLAVGSQIIILFLKFYFISLNKL
jgi:hypothetical protein